MHKLLNIFLVIILLSACGKNDSTNEGQKKNNYKEWCLEAIGCLGTAIKDDPLFLA